MKLSKFLFFFLFYIFFINVSLSFAQMTKEEALSKFFAADAYYKQGKYDQAIKDYEDILSQGRESGALYYNLGNSYFKKGDLGKVILNYRRATLFIPRDNDLKFNYRFALSRIRNYQRSISKSLFERILEPYVSFFNERELAFLILGSMGLLCGLHILSLFLKWPLGWRRGSVVLLIVFVVLNIAGLMMKVHFKKDLAVILAETSSRYEPKEESTVYFSLYAGMDVKILKEEGVWVKIQRPDQKQGWVLKETLEHI